MLLPLWLLKFGGGVKSFLSNKWVQYAILAVVLVAILFFMGKSIYDKGDDNGALRVQAAWDKSVADQKAADAKKAQQQQTVTHQVDTDNVKKEAEIQWQTKWLVKEVSKYVTVQSDAACVVPVGHFRLLDSAAGLPEAPFPASLSADAPSGIALSETDAETADNLGRARACFQRLDQWERWARELNDLEK